ncbi:HpaII restriction endonuclease [Flavobacterium fryxellicola]|uniref:HpaII family restriction endonuclease n=1 Tax=Flavobacterium fryxellicola TaxID=249352 RepID=A0A168AH57_9FLAO|nr:HpaII family restriction endonuclease [Flavobacterium fryxellicola]OAB31466.1 hypothetical protein FBFR_01155 [Flavobacterium fryxellicola]SHN53508.1 HpaII restriction endonuclease [Flavobacterium fryxellicola]
MINLTSSDYSDLKSKEKLLSSKIKIVNEKEYTFASCNTENNFIFKITKPAGLILDLEKINTETLQVTNGTKSSKIALRLNNLDNLGCKIEFKKVQSDNLQLNLKLIDSQLPEIISYLVYYKYKFGKSKITDLLEKIKSQNPLGFDISKGHPFYEYKIKKFLTESALGMTPEKVWTGKYDATGGIIVVKDNSDLVCYHIYNKNEFEDYLINHTKFEQAATSEDEINPGFSTNTSKTKPYKYSWIYEENGELFLKLNLQIRFIK